MNVLTLLAILRRPIDRPPPRSVPSRSFASLHVKTAGRPRHHQEVREPAACNTGTSTYATGRPRVDGEERRGWCTTPRPATTLRALLAQIIFEQESKAGQNLLPATFLRQLIRFYGDSMQMLVPRFLEQSLQTLTQDQDKFRGQMTSARSAWARLRCSTSRSAATWNCSSAPSRCSSRLRGPSAQGRRQRQGAGEGAARSTTPCNGDEGMQEKLERMKEGGAKE